MWPITTQILARLSKSSCDTHELHRTPASLDMWSSRQSQIRLPLVAKKQLTEQLRLVLSEGNRRMKRRLGVQVLALSDDRSLLRTVARAGRRRYIERTMLI